MRDTNCQTSYTNQWSEVGGDVALHPLHSQEQAELEPAVRYGQDQCNKLKNFLHFSRAR